MTAAKSNGASAEKGRGFIENSVLVIGLYKSMIAGAVVNRKAAVRGVFPTRVGIANFFGILLLSFPIPA